jgi:hypothetical protein
LLKHHRQLRDSVNDDFASTFASDFPDSEDSSDLQSETHILFASCATTIRDSSPFYHDLLKIKYDVIKILQIKPTTAAYVNDNDVYYPKLLDTFLNKCAALTPLWSGILLKQLGYDFNRVSDANSETLIGQVKGDFQEGVPHKKVGRFTSVQKERIQALTKELILDIPSKSSKGKSHKTAQALEKLESDVKSNPKQKGPLYFNSNKMPSDVFPDLGKEVRNLRNCEGKGHDDIAFVDDDSPLKEEMWCKKLKVSIPQNQATRFFNASSTSKAETCPLFSEILYPECFKNSNKRLGKITVDAIDFQTLDVDGKLSDAVVSAFLLTRIDIAQREKCKIISFDSLLTLGISNGNDYRRYIQKQNLLDYDVWLYPVLVRFHWILFVVSFKFSILYFVWIQLINMTILEKLCFLPCNVLCKVCILFPKDMSLIGVSGHLFSLQIFRIRERQTIVECMFAFGLI